MLSHVAMSAKGTKAQKKARQARAPKRVRRRLLSAGKAKKRGEAAGKLEVVARISKEPEKLETADGSGKAGNAKHVAMTAATNAGAGERGMLPPPLPVPIATFNI